MRSTRRVVIENWFIWKVTSKVKTRPARSVQSSAVKWLSDTVSSIRITASGLVPEIFVKTAECQTLYVVEPGWDIGLSVDKYRFQHTFGVKCVNGTSLGNTEEYVSERTTFHAVGSKR